MLCLWQQLDVTRTISLFKPVTVCVLVHVVYCSTEVRIGWHQWDTGDQISFLWSYKHSFTHYVLQLFIQAAGLNVLFWDFIWFSSFTLSVPSDVISSTAAKCDWKKNKLMKWKGSGTHTKLQILSCLVFSCCTFFLISRFRTTVTNQKSLFDIAHNPREDWWSCAE